MNAQSITAALAEHELGELAFELRLYREAVLSPEPDIPRLSKAHQRLGLGAVGIAEDLAAVKTVRAVQAEIDAVAQARAATRDAGAIDADVRDINSKIAELTAPLRERLAALAEEREARAGLDERTGDLDAALVAAKKQSVRICSEDIERAVQATPRAAELRSWARHASPRSVATRPGE